MRFRSKTTVAFVGIGLLCIAGIAIVLTRIAEGALREAEMRELVALRENTSGALQTHFRALRRQLRVLADCPVVAEGVETLGAALAKLPDEWNGPIDRDALGDAIADRIDGSLPPTGLPGEKSPRDMVAQNEGGLLLQSLYIARNPHPEDKAACIDAGDGSSYSKAHAQLHPLYVSYYEKFQFYDFFLIEPDGRVVYTVTKEEDLGTNLLTGPLKDTALARAFRVAVKGGADDPPWIEPFTFYPPSGMKPAAFIACPLIRQGKLTGVLAAQIALDEIETIAAGGSQRWKEEVFGKTGEVYLVGPDNTLRSSTRSSIEDLDGYVADLRRNGMDARTLELIGRMGSGVLLHKVATDAAVRALAGETGTETYTCYHGQPALAAYAPFAITPTLRWGIVAKVHYDEAFAHIGDMRRQTIWIGVIAAIGLSALAWALSGFVVSPIRRLTAHARVLGQGDLSTRIKVESRDELGNLAGEFNAMAARLESTTVSKDYVSGILASMMDPLMVIEYPVGNAMPGITAVNKSTCDLLKCTEEELMKRPVDEVIDLVTSAEGSSADDSQTGMYWLSRIRDGRAVQCVELNWHYGDGAPIPMLFSAAPLKDTGGRPTGVVCVGHDLRRRKQMEHVQRERDRLQQELNIAHQVQVNLLPKEPLKIPGYTLAGWSQPATETGGDYYDWLRLPDGRIVINIADATGHGIGPALMVTVCRAYFRAASQMEVAIERTVTRVNDLLSEDLGEGKFVTFAVAMLDPTTHAFKLYSAGHGPNLFFHANQSQVHGFDADDLPLGVLAPMVAETARDMVFEPGDLLFLVTDGFFEWMDPDGKQYGVERLREFIAKHHALEPDAMIEALYQDVLSHARGTPQADDLTAVVIKRLKT